MDSIDTSTPFPLCSKVVILPSHRRGGAEMGRGGRNLWSGGCSISSEMDWAPSGRCLALELKVTLYSTSRRPYARMACVMFGVCVCRVDNFTIQGKKL